MIQERSTNGRGSPLGGALGSLRRRHAGFSYVELMVVIGVIALLAAILLSVTMAVRERARDTLCMSRMRQVGATLLMYAADNHNEILSLRYAPGETGPWQHVTYAKLLQLRGYLSWGQPEIFYCPSWRPYRSADYNYDGVTTECFGMFTPYYEQPFFTKSVDSNGVRTSTFNLNSLPDPSQIAMLADSIRGGGGLASIENQRQYSEFSTGTVTWGNNYGGVHFRHGEKAHFVFFDGSARVMTFDEFYDTVKIWVDQLGITKDSNVLRAVGQQGKLLQKGGL